MPQISTNWRSFNDARSFAQGLGLKSRPQWRKWCKNSGKRPDDIPSGPDITYSDEFIGWGDWLGTNNVSPRCKTYRSFYEARKLARSLGLSSIKDWIKFCKSNRRPDDIPAHPARAYRHHWISWSDWLGNPNVKTQHRRRRSFIEVKQFLKKHHITSREEWKKFCASETKVRPFDIPKTLSLYPEFETWNRLFEEIWHG